MGEDASLDEFLGDDAESATGADDDAESADDADGGPAADDGPPFAPGSVEPATTTYDWSPAGAACDACGATVTERWGDDGGLVCPDCKEW